MMTKETRLLTAQDVANQLQCSRSMAYTLMQRGDIKTIRLGRAVRVTPEALQEFISQGGTLGEEKGQ